MRKLCLGIESICLHQKEKGLCSTSPSWQLLNPLFLLFVSSSCITSNILFHQGYSMNEFYFWVNFVEPLADFYVCFRLCDLAY